MNNTKTLNYWRLILGRNAKERISFSDEGLHYMDMEEALDFLYSRENEEGVRREGGSGSSRLTVAEWITKVKKLFPKETVEILERHALEQYNMTELLTDEEVLKRLEPNRELLKTILQLKHLMRGQVLATAKEIVKKVAQDIARLLEQDIRRSSLGKVDRFTDSKVRSMRNLDMKRTIRQNLKHYDSEKKQLLLEKVYFNGRVQKYNRWKLIIAVDESGSMLDSVIHTAVMAGIFARLPMLEIKLVIFDTQVVDLSSYAEDPVELLMSVQLGGGTNIAGALAYCEGLIEEPHRTMVVLVSDLCEGGSAAGLYQVCRGILEGGSRLIALTALDMEANPAYDRAVAGRLAAMGAYVGAMTPEKLADFIGSIMK